MGRADAAPTAWAFGRRAAAVERQRLAYTTDDLEGPKHTYEIPRRDFVTLNLDLKQMGVGGDNSWGAQPHPEYKIPPVAQSYRFRLRPFSGGEAAVREACADTD